MPQRLKDSIQADFFDEEMVRVFFEIYARRENFYKSIYYYEKVFGVEFDGEDLGILFKMWKEADKYFYEKDKKEYKNKSKNKPKMPRRGRSSQMGR